MTLGGSAPFDNEDGLETLSRLPHSRNMNMEGIDVFVEVIDAQSFTRAARRLGMPTTTVSARIARLEERLGVTLIQRTTRQLHVTAAGRSYYARCVRALAEIAQGERELAAVVQEPTGVLRITAPADLAQALLTPVVEQFLQIYPRVTVDLKITNRLVDIIAEEVDLAVRVGPLEDSTLIVRKFKSGRLGLWATQAYLQHHGAPRTLADLAGHKFIGLSAMPERIALKSAAGDIIDARIKSRLTTDDFSSLKVFIHRGYGIGVLPDFMGKGSDAVSPLLRVLPSYRSEVLSVYFAYPAQRFVPKAVQAFIAIASGEPPQRPTEPI
jgi:DNA-binding transcriptional LysR family regulator